MFQNKEGLVRPQDLFLLVVSVTILMLVFSIVLILYIYISKKRQSRHRHEKLMMQKEFETQLLQSQVEVQEQVFSSLSKELHDNVCQLLTSATVMLGMTERGLAAPSPMLLSANETVNNAIIELRTISKSLSKEWLEQFDLIQNLKTEVNRLNMANNIRLHFTHPSQLALKADKQIMLFRIIQEAVQNAIKHARPKNISIALSEENNMLETIVTNDGLSFEPCSSAAGLGLLNMKHRAHLLSGTINWISNDEGCSVHLYVPMI